MKLSMPCSQSSSFFCLLCSIVSEVGAIISGNNIEHWTPARQIMCTSISTNFWVLFHLFYQSFKETKYKKAFINWATLYSVYIYIYSQSPQILIWFYWIPLTVNVDLYILRLVQLLALTREPYFCYRKWSVNTLRVQRINDCWVLSQKWTFISPFDPAKHLSTIVGEVAEWQQGVEVVENCCESLSSGYNRAVKLTSS